MLSVDISQEEVLYAPMNLSELRAVVNALPARPSEKGKSQVWSALWKNLALADGSFSPFRSFPGGIDPDIGKKCRLNAKHDECLPGMM